MSQNRKLPVLSQKEMVENYQCPGCTCGFNTECGSYDLKSYGDAAYYCGSHSIGTVLMTDSGNVRMALGLPVGFNKTLQDSMRIVIHYDSDNQRWDHLNMPVWAMVQDDILFVRSFSPRVNLGVVHIIPGGKMSDVPSANDVSLFVNEID